MARNWTAIVQMGLAGAFVCGLAGGTYYAVSSAVDYAVAADAQQHARDWTESMAIRMPDLERLIVDGEPDSHQRYQIWELSTSGDVFRFKLFNKAGDLVLISDDLDIMLAPGTKVEDSGVAVKVVHAAGADVLLKTAKAGVGGPQTYAETFLPLRGQDGQVIGAVEAYVDQTQLAQLFHSVFSSLALILAGVFTLVFSSVYAAYLIKTRQAASSLRQVGFLAQNDPTTGLFNRAGFGEAAHRVLAGMGPDDNVTAIHVNIDHFKPINETHGQKFGDAFLRHVGEAIRTQLDPEDVVARLGGDEFVVLALRTSQIEAEMLVKRLQMAAAKPAWIDGVSAQSTVSIGLHFGDATATLDTRMQRADLACFQARLEGRNCYRVYSDALEERLRARQRLEEAIKTGLEEGRFHLAFQPLLDQQTETCAGFEALLRLKDRDGHDIPPTEFIPVAENTGWINAIGTWVLETAVNAATKWPAPLFVSVNLSARQFESGKLVSQVRSLLAETGLDPSRLELEVTESLFINDTEGAGYQLAQLRELGTSVAMDDFGTGYSSLGYLWQFGFDKLKIDRSFVDGITHDYDRSREIIGTIVALGHRLDMEVTAEGIENEQQAALLRELSCDQFQGFLFGRPMPEGELTAFIRRQGRPSLRDDETDRVPVARRA